MAAVLVVSLVLLGTGPARPAPPVTSGRDSLLIICTSPELLSGTNIQDARLAMQMWTDQLAGKRRLPPRLELTVVADIYSALAALREGRIDLLGMTGLDLVRHRQEPQLEPFLVGTWSGDRVVERYALLVRREAHLAGVADLQGRTVLIGTRDSGDLARLWLERLWRDGGANGHPLELPKVVKVEKAPPAVLPVFFGAADACVVPQRDFVAMSELNPQLGQQLVQLAVSPEILAQVVCARRGLDPELKQALLELARTLHQDPAGRQILTLFRAERAVPFEATHLRGIEELLGAGEGAPTAPVEN